MITVGHAYNVRGTNAYKESDFTRYGELLTEIKLKHFRSYECTRA